jgi:hypothetical protein
LNPTALLIAAIAMYGGVQIPNIRLLADPSNVELLLRSSIRTQREAVAKAQIKAGVLPPDAEVDLAAAAMNESEKQGAIKTIGAGNTIVMFFLAGILLMQGAEWWIERGERIEEEKRREAEMKALGLNPGSGSTITTTTTVVTEEDTPGKKEKKEKKKNK